jgi:hypothetical protein
MTQRTTTAWTTRRTMYAVSWDPLLAGQINRSAAPDDTGAGRADAMQADPGGRRGRGSPGARPAFVSYS